MRLWHTFRCCDPLYIQTTTILQYKEYNKYLLRQIKIERHKKKSKLKERYASIYYYFINEYRLHNLHVIKVLVTPVLWIRLPWLRFLDYAGMSRSSICYIPRSTMSQCLCTMSQPTSIANISKIFAQTSVEIRKPYTTYTEN